MCLPNLRANDLCPKRPGSMSSKPGNSPYLSLRDIFPAGKGQLSAPPKMLPYAFPASIQDYRHTFSSSEGGIRQSSCQAFSYLKAERPFSCSRQQAVSPDHLFGSAEGAFTYSRRQPSPCASAKKLLEIGLAGMKVCWNQVSQGSFQSKRKYFEKLEMQYY